jgi:hypothetical protein
MMTLQQVSDRLEIQDLLAKYTYAIDDRNWDALDEVFLPESIIDYTVVGGIRGTRDEIKAWLAGAMSEFSMFQHMTATTELKIDGDTASARTILFNPMIMKDVEKEKALFFVGLWYCDDLVRTPEGWRIKLRYERKSWNTAPAGKMP